jgi:hypothetical protein
MTWAIELNRSKKAKGFSFEQTGQLQVPNTERNVGVQGVLEAGFG